jgi:hypothetical protein
MVQPAGTEAEARIRGRLREGRVVAGRFYYHGPRPEVADRGTFTVENYYELKL